MAKKDYYESLGVNKTASKDEIKKAFRKKAQEHHPDKGGNSEKFKEINEAYSVLADDSKRAQYDQYGHVAGGGTGGGAGGFGGFDFGQGFDWSNVQNGQGFEFDLGDIFGDFFGGGSARKRTKRGSDITIDVTLSFKEAVFGINKKVTITKTGSCNNCKGNGGMPGTSYITCHTCNGKGTLRDVKRTILGSISTTKTCNTCNGKGSVPKEKCNVCAGLGVQRKTEELELHIPSGIENGEVLRLGGGGEAVAGGTPGDLYIRVHVTPHPIFRKNGHNLETDLNIKLSEALLGTERKMETLDGMLEIKIPAGIRFNETLKVRSKGVPYDRKKERGDMLIHIKIEMPKKLSRNAEDAIRNLQKEGL